MNASYFGQKLDRSSAKPRIPSESDIQKVHRHLLLCARYLKEANVFGLVCNNNRSLLWDICLWPCLCGVEVVASSAPAAECLHSRTVPLKVRVSAENPGRGFWCSDDEQPVECAA
ncbi:unnamed protein product [Heligmosomoides polygyrus]|uniref:BHLH domain-containing protein n=1 Tax=Heligmosomoides polygyrus TaxID=6339 RepID=A0A183FIA1_HELPZ|nr:unnamed protein product [Heligmosomoides polygyrus]